MNEEDIYEAFANAAQENYRGGSRQQPKPASQSVGLFNFSSSKQNKESDEADLESVPQIKLNSSKSTKSESATREVEETKRGSTFEEEESKQRFGLPQVNLERGQRILG